MYKVSNGGKSRAMNSLFRSAAVERLGTPDRLDEPIRVTAPSAWLALAALLALVLAGGIVGVAVVVPVKVHGQGIIISAAGILDVPFAATGRVASVGVPSGARVERNTVVARLDQPELRRDLEQARADERDLRDRRQRVHDFLTRSRRANGDMAAQQRRDIEQSLVLVRQRLRFQQERADIEAQLYAKQATTRQKLVDAQIDIGRTEEEVAALQNRLKQLDFDDTMARIQGERELLDLDLGIAAAERRVAALAERLKQAEEVVTPYAGTVVEFKRNVGELVRQGEALLSLLPEEESGAGALGVTLFVSGTDGKKIAPGMVVEVSPSTVRREEYGFLLGRVRAVAALPATEEGMMHTLKNRQLVAALAAGGAPFQVDVEFETDPASRTGYRWSSSAGPDAAITPGTLAGGQIWVQRLPLVEIALPALRRLTRSGA